MNAAGPVLLVARCALEAPSTPVATEATQGARAGLFRHQLLLDDGTRMRVLAVKDRRALLLYLFSLSLAGSSHLTTAVKAKPSVAT